MSDLNNLVKYSNYIVRASQRLTVVEQRIIFSAIAQVPNRPITIDDKFFVTVEDYKKLCPNDEIGNAYDSMKQAIKTLNRRIITIAEEDQGEIVGEIEFHWLSSGSYRVKEGRVGIRFNYEMIPYVNMLREKFTMFRLDEITGFRSSYTQPLYIRLMQYMRDSKTKCVKKTWTEYIDLDTLRVLLDAEKYDKYYDFKRKILDVACRQINESNYTQFTVKFEPHKKERKRVVSLKFSMRLKSHLVEKTPTITDADADPENDTIDMFCGITTRQATLTEKQIDMLADWLSGAHGSKRLEHNGSSVSEVYEFLLKNKAVPATVDANNTEQYRAFFVKNLVHPEFVLLLSRFIEKAGYQF